LKDASPVPHDALAPQPRLPGSVQAASLWSPVETNLHEIVVFVEDRETPMPIRSMHSESSPWVMHPAPYALELSAVAWLGAIGV
jgi:hypothetical protein